MASRTADRRPPPDYEDFTHRQILLILSGLLTGLLLSSLDQTIMATSIQTIANYFHSYSLLAWVTTAYLATSTIATPLYGKLSDLYGRKPCYLAAISIFALGSLGCAFSTSFYELTVLRAVQGVGAGGLLSLAATIVGNVIAPWQRGRYQGYFMGVSVAASVLGLPVGGLLDWLGGVLLTAGITPLLIVAELGRSWGWSSAGSVVCYAVFTVSTLGYVWAERLAGERAITPLRIFTNRPFALGTAAASNAVINDSAVLKSLPVEVARPFQLAFADSMGLVFMTASRVSLLGLLLFVRWPLVTFRTSAGTRRSKTE